METIIKENKEYIDYNCMIRTWDDSHKNKYVITGAQAGECTIDTRIGRVAQVRLEAGAFGSDTVFLRHANDVLRTHENQCFWLIPDKFTEYLDECFKDAYMDDANNEEYTIGGNDPAIGFIIPSPINEGETTPMRDIKSAISIKLKTL